MQKSILIAAVLACPLPVLAQTSASPAPTASAAQAADTAKAPPAGARAYIISPANGATLKSPVLVQFGLHAMGVTQAGSSAANAGHHHLLIDVKNAPAPNEPIPADKSHLHFGAGQTETSVDLPPGRHTLQLVLGDANHQPFSPMVASQTITINVVTKLPVRKKKRYRS